MITNTKHLANFTRAVAVVLRAGLVPLAAYPGSSTPWRCRCMTCGRESSPRYSVIQRGGGCAYCAKKRVDPDEAAAFMRAQDLDPQESYPGAAEPWRCLHTVCGREVFPRYSTVQIGQGGCLWCAGLRVDSETADVLVRTRGFEPLEPFPGSIKPWRCRCLTCGRESSPTYHSLSVGVTRGCKWCAKNATDLDAIMARMTAAGLTPLEPYPGSLKPWRCRHTCGREVSPNHTNIRKGQGGCKWCAGMRVDPDEIAEIMRSKGFEPRVPFPGSVKRWECFHRPCGQIVTPTYNRIQQGRGGCKHCAHQCPRDCPCRAVTS